MEYRVLLPDGTQRWIGARARWVAGDNRKGARLIGVSIDITPRKLAEAEALRQRDELSHLSRVALMGEMSASIAHELNQPLAGILSNAAAGQRFIDRGNVDQAEIRELLGDIISDGRRASDVVRGIRGMVKKEQVERRSVNLNEVVNGRSAHGIWRCPAAFVPGGNIARFEFADRRSRPGSTSTGVAESCDQRI
jgi:Signal transduction histidine kinase regulating C4-dicarboxylate transport system